MTGAPPFPDWLVPMAATLTQERFTGPFRRVVTLPEDADPARIEATYRDGILRISVAKRESSRPRRIEVQ